MYRKSFRSISILIIVFAISILFLVLGITTANAANQKENSFAPIIEIDSSDYNLNHAPVAVVGKPYRVFPASAKDIYGNKCATITKLYVNYDSTSRSQIDLADLTFTPEFIGEYVVEYVSYSAEGNKATLKYRFNCVENSSISINLNDGYAKSGLAGEPFYVADYTLDNESGMAKCVIIAKMKNSDVRYETDSDLSFCPMYSGNYDVEYIYSDYIETKTTSYSITIYDNPNPVFYDDVYIPEFFILGNAYNLPVWECYHFAYGKPAKITPEIKVVYDNGHTEILSDFNFAAKRCGDIRIIFTANYADNVVSKEREAKVVDTGYPNAFTPSNYFVSDNCIISGEEENVKIKGLKSGDSAKFINSVLSKQVDLSFSFNNNADACKEFAVWFTDSVDKDVKVKFSFYKNDSDTSYFAVNDGEKKEISASFSSTNAFKLYYNDENKTVSIEDLKALFIESTYNGEDFVGFPSGKIFLEFCFEKILSVSGVYIEKINNQVLGNMSSDAAPYVVYNKYNGGAKHINDLISVERIFVGDVLDYNIEVNYYIIDPFGEYVTDIYGKRLNNQNTDYTKNYSFYAKHLGNYIVYIFVQDSVGNATKYAYAINVLDDAAPTIKLGDGDESGKVGEKIVLKNADISDNIDTELTLSVFVWEPNGKVISVKNVGGVLEYVPTSEGIYTAYYYVIDSGGNSAIVSYSIDVH